MEEGGVDVLHPPARFSGRGEEQGEAGGGGGGERILRSSEGQLLLDGPQGLRALDQLMLLVWVQSHAHHVGQAAVPQHAGHAQEHLLLHAVHALGERVGVMGLSAATGVCVWGEVCVHVRPVSSRRMSVCMHVCGRESAHGCGKA